MLVQRRGEDEVAGDEGAAEDPAVEILLPEQLSVSRPKRAETAVEAADEDAALRDRRRRVAVATDV